jgi:hypothetical protein
MLILDKTRAMDRMVAQASRVQVPEEFILAAPASEPARAGFRVAVYGPIERPPAPQPPTPWTWELATTARLAG